MSYIRGYVEEPWQAPLILPTDYRDYRVAESCLFLSDNVPHLFQLQVISALSRPRWSQGGKVPHSHFQAVDTDNTPVRVSFFGDTRHLAALIQPGLNVHLWGSVGRYNDQFSMTNPELVAFGDFGRIVPIYPGKPRVARPETVASKVQAVVAADLAQTVHYLQQMLGVQRADEERELLARLGLGNYSIEQLLRAAHCPTSLESAWMCQAGLKRLATYFAIQVAKSQTQQPVDPRAAIPVTPHQARMMAQRFPYPLTEEQWRAVAGTIRSLSEPRASRVAYSADVGAGKTTIFGTVAAACAKAGARVAIIAPNTVLCEQIHDELATTFQEIPFVRHWGDCVDTDAGAPKGSIYIGTTALINRASKAGLHFDLVVVDEEHRFARQQKEALLQDATNYIASTATPIPRTLQLVTLGTFDVYRITKVHVKKTVHTHIIHADEQAELHRYVQATLKHGYQVLIVLPIAQGDRREKQTAEEAYAYWDRLYPGRVGLAHGKMRDADKREVLDRMKAGELSILCATTVIEVGITIPNARTMIIYHPETLGLATLHQLRGRLARKGGTGHLLLYLPTAVKEKTMQRLSVLQRCTDGYRLAEMDLKMRGFGDLSRASTTQTGGMPSLLPGHEITPDDVEEIDALLADAQREAAA
jgi:ATP-dependent DNA helicase RecG